MCWPHVSDGVSGIIFDNSLPSFANGVGCMYDMKESKLEGLTMADCEQQREKMKNQKETSIQAYITEYITHTLYLYIT